MHPNPDRLSRVPLFEGISDEDRALLAGWLDIEEHPAGGSLVREGRTAYEFFVLDEGKVRVEHEGRSLGTLDPGEVFGELAMLGDGHRRADAVAETDVRVFAMFGTHFREMQMTMPTVAERLGRLAQERLAQLDSD